MQNVQNGALLIKNNTAGIELDNITMISGYNQMIDKPTHFISESSSCIDLIFSSNVSLMKNHFTKNVIITLYMEP